ncbi:MAG: peptidoglycan editing factor PgeF [Lachnospiraceae bacterium]|nr:peptidoglycan editing factor PgeF [Lachnospiraceae bacterium]
MEYKQKSEEKILQYRYFAVEGKRELPLFVYPLLENTKLVKHAFTTRLGGCSSEHLSFLNLSFTRGDKKEAVEENYKRLASALDVEYGSFVFSHQTHTTNVLRVGKEDAGNGLLFEQKYMDVDGLITNEPGITLTTFYADCVPLYFVDPVRKAIGLSHSGWRGTVGRMGKVTLEAMHREFGTKPEDVICAIGPSICQDCYEISEDVAIAFKKEFAGREAEILIDKKNGKYQLDLWKANEIVLLEAGVQKQHLAVTNICTCCNANLLFSHRATQGKRGNLAAVLALK